MAMALNAYLKLRGQKQGEIKGSVTQKGREGKINNKNPELQRYSEYEEVSFTYQKIQWTWTDCGITTQDEWGGAIA
jgi:type VI protein secretion system component Hcp